MNQSIWILLAIVVILAICLLPNKEHEVEPLPPSATYIHPERFFERGYLGGYINNPEDSPKLQDGTDAGECPPAGSEGFVGPPDPEAGCYVKLTGADLGVPPNCAAAGIKSSDCWGAIVPTCMNNNCVACKAPEIATKANMEPAGYTGCYGVNQHGYALLNPSGSPVCTQTKQEGYHTGGELPTLVNTWTCDPGVNFDPSTGPGKYGGGYYWDTSNDEYPWVRESCTTDERCSTKDDIITEAKKLIVGMPGTWSFGEDGVYICESGWHEYATDNLPGGTYYHCY